MSRVLWLSSGSTAAGLHHAGRLNTSECQSGIVSDATFDATELTHDPDCGVPALTHFLAFSIVISQQVLITSYLFFTTLTK